MPRDCQWKWKKSNLKISKLGKRKHGEVKTKPKKRFSQKQRSLYQSNNLVSNQIIKSFKMNITRNLMVSNPIKPIIQNNILNIIIHLNNIKINNSIKNSTNKCINTNNNLQDKIIITSNTNNKLSIILSSRILITIILITIILIINIDYNIKSK